MRPLGRTELRELVSVWEDSVKRYHLDVAFAGGLAVRARPRAWVTAPTQGVESRLPLSKESQAIRLLSKRAIVDVAPEFHADESAAWSTSARGRSLTDRGSLVGIRLQLLSGSSGFAALRLIQFDRFFAASGSPDPHNRVTIWCRNAHFPPSFGTIAFILRDHVLTFDGSVMRGM